MNSVNPKIGQKIFIKYWCNHGNPSKECQIVGDDHLTALIYLIIFIQKDLSSPSRTGLFLLTPKETKVPALNFSIHVSR